MDNLEKPLTSISDSTVYVVSHPNSDTSSESLPPHVSQASHEEMNTSKPIGNQH